MRELAMLDNGAVAVTDGIIEAVGPRDELERRYAGHERVDCGGRVLMPGLVDSHTHAIFGRPRADEQEMRAAGLDYMEIAKRGGGIHSSVRDLRARTEEELISLAVPRLSRLAAHGTTRWKSNQDMDLRSTTNLKRSK